MMSNKAWFPTSVHCNATAAQWYSTYNNKKHNYTGQLLHINSQGYNTDKLVDVTDVLLANAEYMYMYKFQMVTYVMHLKKIKFYALRIRNKLA